MAPLYPHASEDHANGFREPLWTRVRYLRYRHFFPVKAWADSRKKGERDLHCTRLLESAARFDRIQLVTPSSPSCRPVSVKLSVEAFSFFQESLWAFMGCEPSSNLREVVELLEQELPAGAR